MSAKQKKSATKPAGQSMIVPQVRDTIESIVIALVMAFVFMTFIAQAFVIPTGSMAPTLYGAHFTQTCSTCGYEYSIDHEKAATQKPPVHVQCPNCGSQTDQLRRERLRLPEKGDGIFVDKWPVKLGGEFFGLHRWDVTVFKPPSDPKINYIKRMIGVPGEVLEIIDGDIYTVDIATVEKELPGALAEFDALRELVYAFPHEPTDDLLRQIVGRYHALHEQLLPLMHIERKLPEHTKAQQSLWRNVYNHDFLPDYESPESPVRWAPLDEAAKQAWDASGREITFASDDEPYRTLQFQGKPITDFSAYNADGRAPLGNGPRHYPVGDLRLRFVWLPEETGGGLRLRLSRDKDFFTAELDTDGTVTLVGDLRGREKPNQAQKIGQRKLQPFEVGRAYSIEFINVDYRVSLRIDGQEVLASTDEQYAPPLDKLQNYTAIMHDDPSRLFSLIDYSTVEIAARQTRCRLRHVAIERDIYYRFSRQGEEGNPYIGWPAWGVAGMPMLLRPERPVAGDMLPGEYFMLGDNSPASKDSRLWWEIGDHLLWLQSQYQVGTITEQQLIGKAVFVYGPARYQRDWAHGKGVIPNLGEIRWIR